MGKKAVIFDLDGTLALRGDRSPYNWSAVWKDRASPPVFACLFALAAQGHEILILSGRDAVCEDLTRGWLSANGLDGGCYRLLMRERGNCEPDDVVKKRMLMAIRDEYDILCVFDDRKKVKRMWVENGVFVFDVNQTDEEF